MSRDYSATRFYDLFSIILCLLYVLMWTHSLEHEVKRPLYFTNITGHIEPILEQNEYCEDNVLNLKRQSWNMLFVRCLDLLRFSCNQRFKKG